MLSQCANTLEPVLLFLLQYLTEMTLSANDGSTCGLGRSGHGRGDTFHVWQVLKVSPFAPLRR